MAAVGIDDVLDVVGVIPWCQTMMYYNCKITVRYAV